LREPSPTKQRAGFVSFTRARTGCIRVSFRIGW
jgi:hypothetical protein